MSKFTVFKKILSPQGLTFPDYLLVSSNHYHMQWTMDKTLRRLKNVIVVMEWSPMPHHGGAVATKAMSRTVDGIKEWSRSDNVNPEIDSALRRCFSLFDTDSDGTLMADDLDRVRSHQINLDILPHSTPFYPNSLPLLLRSRL
jgi:hypothetical protein